MAGDAPLLERLAQLPAFRAAAAVQLVERLAKPQADPVIGPLFGVDEDGDVGVSPLVPAVLKQLGDVATGEEVELTYPFTESDEEDQDAPD